MSTAISSSTPRAHSDLATHLHVPDGFDEHRPHAAVVISTPGSSVTAQIGATYASRLADLGFGVSPPAEERCNWSLARRS